MGRGRCCFVLFFLAVACQLFGQTQTNVGSSYYPSSSGIPLQVIVVRTPEEAQRVVAELKAGKDFGELAKQVSVDATANADGYMGRFQPNQLRAELRDALKGLQPGQYSRVVHIPSGYAILKIMKPTGAAGSDSEGTAATSLPSQLLDRTEVPPPSAYAGEAACAQCHAKQAKSYASTPHALDSSLASRKRILGDFSPQHDVLRTRNPHLEFVMIASPRGEYEKAVDPADPQNSKPEMKRLDIVIGSGRHGQTYLHWEGDELFELPVSYWGLAHRWVNSPGYPDGELHWDRSVGPRCLECHASYFAWLPMPVNRYDKDRLVVGIDCERCHGPGALHVARERSTRPPRASSPEEAIVNPARLSQDQQLSLCSLCHAGGGPPIRPPMSFVVGDDIHDYLKIIPPPANAPVDVHGNQVGALEQSKCFTSGKLNCSTCHNVHRTQENADTFSSRCLTCHTVKACGRYTTMRNSIVGKCIECHMPVAKSNAITTANAGQSMQLRLRTHRIAIYPDANEPEVNTANRAGAARSKTVIMR